MIEHKNKPINVGVQLLRMILCFWVIIVHLHPTINNKNWNVYIYSKHFHVPCFMFITFYYYYRHLENREINKIIYRFKRLMVPYLIWPFIYLIINNIQYKYFNIGIYNRILSAKNYFFQVFGIVYYAGTFWYLEVVLFISLIFTLSGFLLPNKFLFIIQLFGVAVYRIHYSQIYNILKYRNFFRLFLVLLIRMLPIAIVGLTFGSLNLLDILKRNYKKYIFINLVFLYFLFNLDIFNIPDKPFRIYADIDSNTLASINFFYFFSLLPFGYIKNKKILLYLRYITNHTGGIYYLHPFIIFYLRKIIIFVKSKNIFGIIIIYISTYFLCFLGNIIFKKSFLKFLFN